MSHSPPPKVDPISDQAERFYRVFSELLRAYQFRDRQSIVCRGLSVSQCYALDALDREGPLSMGQLAQLLFLDVSTMTRVVDHLVAAGLVTRVQDRRDRRVCKVKIAARGRTLYLKIKAGLISEYEEVLGAVPARSREAIIETVSRLLSTFRNRERRPICSGEQSA